MCVYIYGWAILQFSCWIYRIENIAFITVDEYLWNDCFIRELKQLVMTLDLHVLEFCLE